jgi:lipoprotein-releasing system ATP-binding protein
MRSLNQHLATSFVVVTHDERFAATLDRVLVLNNGCLQAADA